jgi:hypothetical protein
MFRSMRFAVLLSLFVMAALAGLVTFRDAIFGSLLSSNTVPGWSLPYRTEVEWIVAETARSVVDLATFAGTGTPAPLGDLSITNMTASLTPRHHLSFQVGSRSVALDLDTYVWDPDKYVALALAAGVKESGSSATAADEIVDAVVNLDAETLQAQSQAVSAALQQDSRHPAHHEAAAFLLTAFALREASGVFYDPRPVLGRASAHLAVARAIRGTGGKPTLVGQVADITLQVVGGRPGPAMRQLDALERQEMPPAAAAWGRALRRRATLDWRLPPPDGAPLVERLEYMRALARMVTPDASLDYLRSSDPEPVPDWGWRTLDFAYTVENGHVFVEATMADTLAEAGRVLGIEPATNARTAVTAALTREPAVSSVDRTTPGSVRVIDNGMWSAFYQRHLAHVAMRGSEFYREMYGSKGDAAAFDTRVDELLQDVPLWLILQRVRVTTPEGYRAAMTRVTPLLRKQPQAVPYMAWSGVLVRPPVGAEQIDAPRLETWFPTLFPNGTAFETRRMSAHAYLPTDVVGQIDALHELSPWDPLITINRSVVRCQPGCTPEQERANYSLIAEYSLASMLKFAYTSPDPAASLSRVCEMSAAQCHLQADWLLSRDRFVEATQAFEKYIKDGRDRVGVSNRIEWLVRHYQGTGRAADARRVAEMAAQVGSAAGLRALAGFHERGGEVDRAEELYRDIYRRYDIGTDLLAFRLRRAQATGQKQDGPEYVTLVQRYFEGGLQPARLDSPAGPPARGLRVTRTTAWNEKAGFRTGDIVVAIDGIQAWTTDHYLVLYAKSFGAPLRFSVWRPGKYVEIEGPFRQYYYGVDLQAYPAGSMRR